MPDSLPAFPYHPDPVETGSVVASAATCRRCGRARGWVYAGPVYAVADDLDDALCPWCVADGSAAAQFDAEFVDAAAVGGGAWGALPSAIVEAVAHRTPGFCGWQQERWWAHCGDAAAYLGRAGARELAGEWAAALPAIRAASGVPDADWAWYVSVLDRGGMCTAYVFRCRHCGALGGYSDCG